MWRQLCTNVCARREIEMLPDAPDGATGGATGTQAMHPSKRSGHIDGLVVVVKQKQRNPGTALTVSWWQNLAPHHPLRLVAGAATPTI